MKIILHKIAKLIELYIEHFLTLFPNGLAQTNSSQYNMICIVLFEDVLKGLFL